MKKKTDGHFIPFHVHPHTEGVYDSEWTEWDSCTVTCGGGIQNRIRMHTCRGLEEETRDCNAALCPVLNDWQPWSECSSTCYNGVKTRLRSCANGVLGDLGCEGSPIETMSCGADPEPTWQSWSPWSDCSVS